MPESLIAIDLGSNAVRLIVASVLKSGELKRVSSYRVPLRLGDEVFSSGMISTSKIEQVISVFQAFKHLIDFFDPWAYRACATSAMREAGNAPEVVQMIREQTGISLEIISGEEEARLLLANRNEKIVPAGFSSLYIDVGGGSTEVSLIQEETTLKSASFRIGSIRSLNGKVAPEEWEYLRQWVQELPITPNTLAVGTGGNIGKLRDLSEESGKVTTLSRKKLKDLLDRLAALSYEERMGKYNLKPDRADVIVPAGQIYHSILKWLGLKEITIPMVGVSDGILRELAQRQKM